MTITMDYSVMEPMLQEINKSFIALPPEEVAENNYYLYELLDKIIHLMREKNDLFKLLFHNKFFGGSYWDRVKVGQPDEYDVHIQCKLYNKTLEPSNQPGWVNLKFKKETNYEEKKKSNGRRRKPFYGILGLHVLINHEGYLDTEKVMLWFHQILANALGGFKKYKHRHCSVPISKGTIKMKFKRHGPAFTFSIKDMEKPSKITKLDFVPCFVFGRSQYPVNGFRQNNTTKEETFIVAKPIKANVGTRYWRLSFQNQERELMKNKVNFKPALKLLKKMRSKFNHEFIASYFLKNFMLWQLDKRAPGFWSNSLSNVFMSVLYDYQQAIQNKTIEFYWYSADNLIDHVKDQDLLKVNNTLKKIIADVNKCPNSITLAKYFLNRKEYQLFRKLYLSV